MDEDRSYKETKDGRDDPAEQQAVNTATAGPVNTEGTENPNKATEAEAVSGNRYTNVFEKHKENIYFRWGLTAVAVVVVCILAAQLITKLPAIYAAVGSFMKTLSAVLYGVCIAYVLNPIVRLIERLLLPRLEGRFRKPGTAEKLARGVGVLVAMAFLILLVWALLAMIIPQLIESISGIIRDQQKYYDNISGWLTKVMDRLGIQVSGDDVFTTAYNYAVNYLTESVLPKLQTILTSVTTSVVGMVKGVMNVVVGVIVSIYLLAGKERFLAQSRKVVYAVCGQERGGIFCNVCTFANRVFSSFIGGKLVDSAIIGVICFVGMTILKLPYALLISVVVGCTNIIPVFGPFLGGIPSVIFLLVIDPMSALIFGIFVIVLQQVDGNIIGPKILGDATGLGSFWVVVAILIFGSLWGVAGMIVGVPLFAVIYKIISEITNHYLEKRGMSTKTDDYVDGSYPDRRNVEVWTPQTRKEKRQIRRNHRRELRALQKLDRLHLLHIDEKLAEAEAEETEEKSKDSTHHE